MLLHWFLTMLASRDPKSTIVCWCFRIYPTWNSLICTDNTKWDRKWYSHMLPQHHFSSRCTFYSKIHIWDSWWVTTEVLVWLDNLLSYNFFLLRCTKSNLVQNCIVLFSDFGVYSLASPNFDYDSNSSFEVVVDCTDSINTVSESLFVYLIKNSEPVVHNLPSKLYFRRFFFLEINDSHSIRHVSKPKSMNIQFIECWIEQMVKC